MSPTTIQQYASRCKAYFLWSLIHDICVQVPKKARLQMARSLRGIPNRRRCHDKVIDNLYSSYPAQEAELRLKYKSTYLYY